MKGKFVVIEGDVSSGITTFLRYLKERHPEFNYIRDPGGTWLGEKVQGIMIGEGGRLIDPLTRFHMYWGARTENLKKLIIPALEMGKVVVCDRFDASTFAFQIGGDGHRELEPLFWATRDAHMLHLPVTYIYFKVPQHVSERRLRNKLGKRHHFDEQSKAYRGEVSRHYQVFFSNERIQSHITFESDMPKRKMLAEAYKLFQEVIK